MDPMGFVSILDFPCFFLGDLYAHWNPGGSICKALRKVCEGDAIPPMLIFIPGYSKGLKFESLNQNTKNRPDKGLKFDTLGGSRYITSGRNDQKSL